MGIIADEGVLVFTDGPSENPNQVNKVDARAWVRTIDSEVVNAKALALTSAIPPVAVRAIVTSNVAISNGLENGDTVDGLTAATGEVFVLAGQTDKTENGPRTIPASGAASRTTGYTTGDALVGATFYAREGSHEGEFWTVTNTEIELETDDIIIVYSYDQSISLNAEDIADATETGIALITATDAAAAQTALDLVPGTDVQAFSTHLAALVSAAKTDGNFVVTDGTTFTVESGATARASLGLIINTDVQAYDSDIAALAANSTNGLLTRTGSGTAAARTIAGTSNQISVANGDGVSGNPTLSLPSDVLIPTVVTVPNTGLHVLDTNASHDLIIKPGSDLSADRTLNLVTGDADRTVTFAGNFSTSGAYALTLTATGATNVTLPTTGTLATETGVTAAVAAEATARAAADLAITGTKGDSAGFFSAGSESGAASFVISAEGTENYVDAFGDEVDVAGYNDGGGSINQVVVNNGSSATDRRVTMSDSSLRRPMLLAPGLVRASRADTGARVFASYKRGNTFPSYADYYHIPSIGDSTSVGSVGSGGGAVALNAYAPSANVLMFNGGIRPNGVTDGAIDSGSIASLTPALDNLHTVGPPSNYGSTGLLSMGYALAENCYNGGQKIVVSAHGRGGLQYAGVAQGSTTYDNLMATVAAGVAIAAADSGKTWNVPAVILRLGSNDAAATVDHATYLGYLEEFRTDIQADIMTATGQTIAPKIIMLQQSRNWDNVALTAGVISAQFEMATTYTDVYISTPQYIADFEDNVHFGSSWHNTFGGYEAKAIMQALMGRTSIETMLYPVSSEFVSTTERIITFNRPVMLSELFVVDPGRAGIRMASGNVRSATVLDDGRLRVVITTAHDEGTGTMRFGTGGFSDGPQGFDSGPRTTIVAVPRPGEFYTCPSTGKLLLDHCVHSSLTV